MNKYTVICDWANCEGCVEDSDEVVVFAENEASAVAMASESWRKANEGVVLIDAWVLTPERLREFL